MILAERLPVDLTPVPDPDHQNHELVVLDRVDDAVVTLSNPIERLGRALEPLCDFRPGLLLEPFDAAKNAFHDGRVELSKLTPRGGRELDDVRHRDLQAELFANLA